MDLHRSSNTPDWETIKPSKRTAIQNVAASTHGIITPPNIISVIGLALVIYGVIALTQENFWIGFAALVVGRLLDVVDGLVAQATGTKSALGEFVDASIDKVGTLLTIVALFIVAPEYWWLITALLIPQIIIPFVSFYKKQKKKAVHPTRQGKLGMASLWVAIAGLITVKAFDVEMTHPLAIATLFIAAVSTILTLYALWQYSTGKDQD